LSREARGFRIVEGDLARAANIRARLVADFDPGILTDAFKGLLAADKPLRNGALQLDICLSLPSTVFRRFWIICAQRRLFRGINQWAPRFYQGECCAKSTGQKQEIF
jgi:hypothetical protein